jgi:hypothetical protein
MSCEMRHRHYRASVTANAMSVSWGHPTGHAHRCPSLRLSAASPKRVAMETDSAANTAPIPLSLVQDLCARCRPPDRDGEMDEGTVAAGTMVGMMMASPHWCWPITVLPDQSPSSLQDSLVVERDGQPVIAIPIDMLRALWRWVLYSPWVVSLIAERAPILRWWRSIIDSPLWQELRAFQQKHGPWAVKWEHLYGYLPPLRFPDIVRETHHLLSSADPDDQQMALTVLEQWLASDDHATRRFATQMLSTWLHARPTDGTVTDDHLRPRLRAITILASDTDPTVICAHLYHLLRTARNQTDQDGVQAGTDLLDGRGDGRSLAMGRWMSLLGEMVRDHPSDAVIREVLDGIMSVILSSARPDDRVGWAATLWNLMTDPTCSDRRRRMIAAALTPMMQDPMVGSLLRAWLWTHLSPQRIISEPVWDSLLAPLIRTVCADEVVTMIEQALATVRATMETDCDPIVRRFDRILAAGWGNGQDHRILQIIDSLPGPHWQTVLTEGVTTSVSAEVCDRLRSWFPHDQAFELIVDHIHAREQRGDWSVAPLPASLIPWVCEAACSHPNRLHPTTVVRRLWLDEPDYAWNVTCTMLGSPYTAVRTIALAALDAGWGTGHDAAIATILRTIILQHPLSVVLDTACATVVAGIGRAAPAIIESLLTDLMTRGDTEVRRQLIRALHRGWGRGQDDLVWRVVETMGARDPSDRVWGGAHDTLARAWDYQPPDVVVSLVDRMVTHRMIPDAIATYAPGWDHLPTAHMIERIAHHVAHLCAHAYDPTISRYRLETLISAWASVIAAGAKHMSAADIHALLSPLWNLSPRSCLFGFVQWFRR